MSGHNAAPVIIKRKKKVMGGGHHGGAWKVAYADFVTAMMAFFMLMWLLNATTEKQRKGLADYFNPTIPITRVSGGGEDVLRGDSTFAEQDSARNGAGATSVWPTDMRQARGESGADDQEDSDGASDGALAQLERILNGSGGESMVSEQLMRHVVTRQTDEGLIVELFDLPGEPMFRGSGSHPTPVFDALLGELAGAFTMVRNKVAIAGHLASRPVVAVGLDPWEVSSSRAAVTRRILLGAGLPADRIQRLTGYADRKPVTANAMAPRNARIEIVLLRSRT